MCRDCWHVGSGRSCLQEAAENVLHPYTMYSNMSVRCSSELCIQCAPRQQCQCLQSVSNGSALKGAAFWAWYDEGQVGPQGEGGGDGLYGIRDTSSTFDIVRSNAKSIAGYILGLFASKQQL